MADAVLEPRLADGSDLIRHRLVLFPFDGDVGLRRVEPLHVGRERNDLNAIQDIVGCIHTDDHSRARLPDLPTDGGVETNPPDLTPPHRRGLPPPSQPIPPPPPPP